MVQVIENQLERRFEATVDDATAGTLDFVFDGDVMVTTSTVVARDYEGRGVGSQLAQAALKSARDRQLKVRPQCSFIASYIVKHPEFADLLES
ncbi:MAG: N-acetyltransferase [Actinobacteria bacterium]|nr:N-acetyltransferase [Actinomycetota bacterium]